MTYQIVSNSYDQEGEALAQKHQWGGMAILYIAHAALIEANFHHEARHIEQLISDQIPF